jgi:predicted  nucleic acid-binding Zn-ribbon protein
MSAPSKRIGRLFFFLLAILIILLIIFVKIPRPCHNPITYRLGNIDERFNLTREEFKTAVNMAAAMWGKPFHRDLFREDPDGAIEIKFLYDYRQEATDKLKKLNFKIDRSKESYETLKSHLENLRFEYEQKKTAFNRDFNDYNAKVNTFNSEVELWNRRGEIPQSIHIRRMKEKDELSALSHNLNARQEAMKTLVDTMNSMVVVINEIASNNNLDMDDHQKIGNTLGREFCEGYYEYKNGRRSITIYQYENEYRLVRVLAHEFGHALGLNHSKSAEAVIYPLIRSDSLELAAEDIAALREHCKIH